MPTNLVNPVASRSSVHSAIAQASQRTGMDFHYLLGQAQVESGLRADARAGTSSATGLYQFIEQSWLGVVKRHGGEHGLGWAAGAIGQTANGRYIVSDPGVRRAILNLRNDPQVASLMAAEHASDNKAALEQTLGREAGGTDLYMAHFLGLGGARQFLSAMEANPDRSGAAMFPAAARANRSIFYTAGGQPRSLSDIYQRFAAKLDKGAMAAGSTGPQPASPFQNLDPGVEVLLGNEAEGNDRAWVETTLANLNVIRGQQTPGAMGDPIRTAAYRPTPETARLAYLMLANLGA
ncbi:lytic transglycosylase domain-containing protein [Sphingomonas sp. FW199]|uniref:lytic transglycosylase domain-containing protein n=1 Tax=Sphingomonas sp. FW199 TaxID=3400217 RepID=UPI003CFAA3AB